jgi:SnoaL-like polyketide cyclase
VFHSPKWSNWPRGIEGARKLATYGRQLYRDARAAIDDIIAENDRVAVRWTIAGPWIGLQRPGSPPYGQQVAVGSMSWYRFVDGKIVGRLGHRGIATDRTGQRWIDGVEATRRCAKDSAARARSSVKAEQEKCLFRHEGDYWLISFDGISSRLRHTKGMVYLAYLLQHPSIHVSAIVLADMHQGSTPASNLAHIADSEGQRNLQTGLGDAGAVLDTRAKAEYRQRLNELRSEMNQAAESNDIGRKERLQKEIDFLTAELIAAIGKNGADLKAASHPERARQAVYKTIQFSLGQIRRTNPPLAAHLTAAIRTGYNCAYLPQEPIRWVF